jgi:ferredoxin/flavodoxin---NADP+ reductase
VTDTFTVQRITSIHAWTLKLFSFTLTRPAGFRFEPGQWARLGVHTPEGTVWRAYSIASANYADELEFYSIVVPDGAFTSRLAQLKVSDEVLIDKQPYGFLTTSRFQPTPPCDLWMLSTGTGLAPFLSILQDPQVWQDYRQLIIVHGVRDANELAYATEIKALSQHELFSQYVTAHANKLVYVPCVTREPLADALPHRITTALLDGSLEQHAGAQLDLTSSRIMLCGNPDMVSDTRSLLKTLGFTVSRSAKPGQIAVENYW